jgi:hypothetical protein
MATRHDYTPIDKRPTRRPLLLNAVRAGGIQGGGLPARMSLRLRGSSPKDRQSRWYGRLQVFLRTVLT